MARHTVRGLSTGSSWSFLRRTATPVITQQQSRSQQLARVTGVNSGRLLSSSSRNSLAHSIVSGRCVGLDLRRGADHDAPARDPNALFVGVSRRKGDSANGGAEADPAESGTVVPHVRATEPHSERGLRNHRRAPPSRPIQTRRTLPSFLVLEPSAQVSRKMRTNHRVADHARIAAEIAPCRACEDLALASDCRVR